MGKTMNDRERSVCLWAKSHMESRDFVIVDTETTGLDTTAEVVSVAVVNAWGRVAFQSLVKPTYLIDESGRAFSVHGISDDMVRHAPYFEEVEEVLRKLLNRTDCFVIAYNAEFDCRMLNQSKSGVFAFSDFQCAMLRYAEYFGEEGFYGDYRWQRLENACAQMSIEPAGYHDAASDALATYALMVALASRV